MAVGENQLAQERLAYLCPRHLGKADEELLKIREAAGCVRGRRLAPGDVCVVCRRQPGDIRDVLAERELPVHVQPGKWLIGIVLGDELCRGRPEVVEISRRPPVRQLAGRVELAALVVETVADLVS